MKTKFQNYLNHIFRQPIVDRFQTPARRRVAAAAVIVWQLVVVGTVLLISRDLVWPVFVAGIVMWGLISMLNMSTRGIFELADEHLDEYQISLRDAAYRKAYFFSLLWLLLIAPVIGFFKGADLAALYTLAFILLGFFWGLSAPRVLVAWTLPADTDED